MFPGGTALIIKNSRDGPRGLGKDSLGATAERNQGSAIFGKSVMQEDGNGVDVLFPATYRGQHPLHMLEDGDRMHFCLSMVSLQRTKEERYTRAYMRAYVTMDGEMTRKKHYLGRGEGKMRCERCAFGLKALM